MDTSEIRRSLESKLSRLSRRVAQIESELRSAGSSDSEERAVEVENHEVLERLDEAERQELKDIRGALNRIDSGTYAVCTRCGGTIPAKRLEALPYTDMCVDCAG